MEYFFNSINDYFAKFKKIHSYFPTIKRNADLSNLKKFGKYAKLAVFCMTLICCAGTYCGWQFLVTLFEEKRVYHWLCNDQYETEGCDDQKEALQFLFTVALSANYFLNPIAAIVFEIIGPKFTAIIGCALVITGYYLISISSQAVDLFIPGMLLIGGCADFFTYAAFSISPLFSYPTLITGLLLGSSCISWWIPGLFTIIDTKFSWSLSYLFAGYATVVLIPASIIYILFVPRNAVKVHIDTNSKLVNLEVIENDKSTIVGSDNNSQSTNEEYFFKVTSESSYKVGNELVYSGSSDERPTDVEDNSYSGIYNGNLHFLKNEFPITIVEKRESPSSFEEYIKEVNYKNAKKSEKCKMAVKNLLNHPIIPILVSPQHLAVMCFWAISIFRFAFYFSSISFILGEHYTIILGYISPLCCIFYPTYGYLVDAIGFYRALHIINFVNIFMYISSILAIIFPQVTIISWIAVILYPASYGPYIFLLAYAKYRWGHIRNYIAIIGFNFIIAGFVSLLTTVVYKLVMDSFDGNFLPIYSVITLFSILLFPLFWLMKKWDASNV